MTDRNFVSLNWWISVIGSKLTFFSSPPLRSIVMLKASALNAWGVTGSSLVPVSIGISQVPSRSSCAVLLRLRRIVPPGKVAKVWPMVDLNGAKSSSCGGNSGVRTACTNRTIRHGVMAQWAPFSMAVSTELGSTGGLWLAANSWIHSHTPMAVACAAVSGQLMKVVRMSPLARKTSSSVVCVVPSDAVNVEVVQSGTPLCNTMRQAWNCGQPIPGGVERQRGQLGAVGRAGRQTPHRGPTAEHVGEVR